MNKVELKGVVRNIRQSHKSGDTIYDTFELVQGDNVFDVVFKEGLLNKIREGEEVQFSGHVRTHMADNHVYLYVNTYFDEATEENKVELDGVISRKENIFTYKNSKSNIHFVIVNTITLPDGRIMLSSIPCVARNKIAREFSENFNSGDSVHVFGSLKCRVFQKGDELKVTHEVEVLDCESIV